MSGESSTQQGLAAAAEDIWQTVSPLLPGLTVEVLPRVDSTNTELMRRARGGDLAPTLLVALHQTAGRGRLGRPWHSAQGDRQAESLTFSLGLPLAAADWSGLSLAVGVSIAESLHPLVRLKWPNDLWLAGDRKLGGILIETMTPGEPAAARYAVVGVGLNINRPSVGAEALSVAPAALDELLPGVTPAQALLRLALPLVQSLQAFEALAFSAFQARFHARDALFEREVAVHDGRQGVTQGTAHGVTPEGALLVHTARGMQLVTSSEVSVRPLSSSAA